MGEKRERMMDRIAKLLELSNSKNKNESQTAMLKAQKLMAKYKIEMSEVEGSEEEADVEGSYMFSERKKYRGWKYHLGTIIAENFGCRLFRNTFAGKSNMRLVGKEDDIKIVKQMYFYAETVLEEQSYKFAKKKEALEGANMNQVRNDYIRGFIHGLEDKFEEQKEKMTDEQALVLKPDAEVDKWIDENMNVTEGRGYSMNTAGDAEAYASGHQRGKSIKLHEELKK